MCHIIVVNVDSLIFASLKNNWFVWIDILFWKYLWPKANVEIRRKRLFWNLSILWTKESTTFGNHNACLMEVSMYISVHLFPWVNLSQTIRQSLEVLTTRVSLLQKMKKEKFMGILEHYQRKIPPWLGPSQDITYALILRYVSKIIYLS